MRREPHRSSRRYGLIVLLVVLICVSFFRTTRAVPANFQNEVLIAGLEEPTGLAFAPDGRMLIIQRGGSIKVVQPGGTTPDPIPFLQITNINGVGGERGLVGIALDPNFATNSQYYVFYTADTPLRDRVSRFTASGNTTPLGSEVVVWEDNVPAADYHHGGTVAFGPDGNLYISTGDGFNAPDSQDLQSFHGKILRIRPDGSVPTDNPFFDGPGPNLDAIWALGLRNPFRFSVDSATGRMYIADVGASLMEEVNIGAPGANYGWPICEGNCNTPGMTNPIFVDPHDGRDSSITGGFVYRGSQFPPEYVGSYFYGDYVQNWVRRLTFDANGNVSGNLYFEPADGTEDGPYGEVVDLKQGPEGALYYVDYGTTWEGESNPGRVRRIRYTPPGNQPPVAQASANPTSGLAPLTVNFSSAGSSDPEGQSLTYSWTFGDGATSTEPNPSHTYTQNGPYTARLSVSDGVNTSLSLPVFVSVGNAPTGVISSPTNGATFRAGDTITFSGSGTDPEDGTLGPGAFSWTVLFLHDSHTHPYLGPVQNTTSGSFVIETTGHDYSGNTRLEIFLTVRDSDGLQHTSSVLIYPQKVNLTFDTAPSGLQLRLDGINRTTPFVADTLIGFQHSIEAPDQTQGGTAYSFASWPDGGARLHTLVVPETSGSYVATYQAAPMSSLRFHGNGVGDIDRVKILIDAPARPADIGAGSFTLEFWMKAGPQSSTGSCSSGNDAWIAGNIVFDRDVFYAGDFGDYGLSIMNGRIAFGVNNGTTGATACGSTNVVDNVWHHIAVTRNASNGQIRVLVDGVFDGEVSGPTGDLSYRDGRATGFPNSDPYLVIGAEKHDAGPGSPSYDGWVDEVRLSNSVRYTSNFTRPSQPFSTDANTVALYHFDEGSGDTINDVSGAGGGPSNGVRKFGGTPAGPEWSTDTPFGGAGPCLSISPTSQSFLATGGAGSINVTAPGSCSWTAVSSNSFISIVSGGSGSGNGTVNYSVEAHTGATSRSGTITISGRTFSVFQAADGADTDGDGIPDAVEVTEGTNPLVRDNDVFNNARLFAMQQYRDFLGREGDSGGVGFWTNQINSGALTRAQVIQSFFNSAEFQNTTAPITRLYFAYFLRIPDYGGLLFWVNQFRSGVPLARISEAFAQSGEFQARYGSLDNAQFVSLVYNNVLGRAPDPGGLAFWVGQLNSGSMTRGRVMLEFSESTEYRNAIANEVFVTQVYVGMLRRSPDQGGFDFWVAALDGGASGLVLIQGFLDSIEYRNRFLP